MDSSGEGISVAIRMRPLNDREINGGQSSVFRVKHNSVEQLTKEGQPIEGQTYNYNQVFGEAAGNKDVYTGIAKDVVKGVVGGINGTIFAYGQTSSGKTHTMLGGGNEPGVLEMAATEIFERIAQCDNREFLMRVSFVEIYNELIYDLLCDSKDDALINIREDPRRGVYCEATEKIITDYESITKALHRGMSRRTVESTAMNETSSRSHSIFKLVVESRQKAAEGSEEPDGAVLVASLTLVDLAGSESVKHTQAAGQRAKEGGKINQSLLSLSRVIHSLSQPGAHVAYRDSKLTRLLQPSLSGNAKMCIVCCVTSAEKFIEETRSTLQFASRAKLVTTHATVNEVMDDATKIKRLNKELTELRARLSANEQSANSIAGSSKEMELLQKIGELEDQLESARATADETAAAMQSQQEQTAAALAAMQQNQEEQAASAAQQLETAAAQAQTLEDRVARFLLEKEEMETNISELEQEVEELEEAKERQAQAHAELLAEMKAAHGASAGEVEAKLEELLVEKAALAEQIACQNDKLTAFEQQQAVLQQQLSEATDKHTAAAEAVAALEAVVQQKHQEEEALTAEFDRMLSAKDEEMTVCLAEKCTELKLVLAEKEELEAQIQELGAQQQAEGADKEAQEATIAALSAQVQALSEQLEASQGAASEAQQQAETGAAQAEVHMQRISALEAELDAQTEKIIALSARQEEEQELAETQILLNQELTAQVQALQAQLTEATVGGSAAVEALKEQLAAAQTDFVSLTETSSAEIAALVALKDEQSLGLESISATAESLEKLVGSLQEQLDASMGQLQESLAGEERVTLSLATSEAEAQQLRAAVRQLEATSAQASESGGALLTTIESLRGELTAAAAQKIEAQAAIESLRGELTAAAAQKIEAQAAMRTLEKLVAQQEELDNEVSAELESTLAAKDQQIQSLVAQTEVLSTENDDLRSSVDLLTLEVESVQAEAAAALAKAQEAADAQDAEAEAHEAAKVQTAALEEQLQCKQAEVEALSGENADLSELNQGLLEKQEAAEEQLSASQTALEALTAEHAELNGKFDDLMDEHETTLGQLEKQAEEAAALQETVAQLEAENASLSANFSNTNSNLKEVAQQDIDMAKREAKKSVEAMSVVVGQKDDQISKLMEELDQASRRAAEAEQARAQLEERESGLLSEDESTRRRVGQLQTSLDLVVSERDVALQRIREVEVETRQMERASVQTEEELRARVEQLSQQVETLQTKLVSAGNADASHKFMEAQLSDARAERDELRALHQTAVNRVDELESNLASSSAELEALQALSGGEQQMQELVAERNELAARLAEQEADLAETSAKLKRSKEDYAVIKAEWERGETALEELEATLRAEFQTQLEQVRADADAAAANVPSQAPAVDATEEYKLALMQLSEDLAEQKKAFKAAEEAAAETQEQLVEATAQLEVLGSTNAALQQQNQLLQLEAASAAESLAELQQQRDAEGESQSGAEAAAAAAVAELEVKVVAAQDEVQHYKQIAVELDDTVRLAQRERLQQEQQCDALRTEIAHLEEQMAELKANGGYSVGEEAPVAKDTEELISELNEIMEEKIELESRLQQSEAECRRCQEQLADYDSKSAKEQAEIMKMAQEEIDRLSADIARLTEQLEASAASGAAVHQGSAHSDQEFEQLSLELAAAAESHKAAVKELEHKLRKSEASVEKYENKVIALDEKVEKQKALLVEKDQRIQHLDRNKITKEFSERFKDALALNKTLEKESKKHQKSLESLKASYDELVKQQLLHTGMPVSQPSTRSATAAAAGAAPANAELEAELEKTKKREGQLRDKLRQIVAQMQENENERADIIDILAAAGIDTSSIGVDLCDLSGAAAEAQAGKITELTDGIQLLADRHAAAQKEVREQMKYMTKQQAEASGQFYQEKEALCAKIAALEADVAASKASYAAKEAELLADIEQRERELRMAQTSKSGAAQGFEDKLENLKNNCKSLREANQEAEAVCEQLRAECARLQADLKTTATELDAETDRNNTEIKILGEENLELMTEIKELRKKCMALEALKGGASSTRGAAITLSSSVHSKLSETVSHPSSAALGDITASVASRENVRSSEPDAESRVFKGKTAATAQAAAPAETKKVRTKATPLVATNAAVVETDGESPGECNQS